MRQLTIALIFCAAANAQPVAAPTNAPTESPRGRTIGDYNILQSFEVGYRFRDVAGSLDRYRSDVNFGNGVRLLGSTLSVHSRDGHGKWFDEFVLNTIGLGNDPYQYVSARAGKSRLYQYDSQWRLNEYFNPALPIANGQHRIDTTRTLQDHSLVLLPQSPFRLFAGYSRVRQSGPAFSTLNWPDTRGDEFPLFTDIRRTQNEYRLGAEVNYRSLRWSILRSWERFADHTARSSGESQGNNPADATAVAALRRTEPYTGTTDGWRSVLRWEHSKRLGGSGRFTYSAGRRAFAFDESLSGITRFGAAQNRQTLLFGDARRPVVTGSWTFAAAPARTLTITNHTAYHHTRMEGDGAYRELNNGSSAFALANFEFLGIRTLTNTTDADLGLGDRAGVVAGYQFSARRIRSIEQTSFEGFPDRLAAEQDNVLHAGRAGLRLQPWKPLRVVLDTEIGRTDRPIYPTSERNYHAINGRLMLRTRRMSASALYRTFYNTNSASISAHSARSRNLAADVSWQARTWLAFDANYSRLRLDTETGIAYFAAARLVTGDRSIYRSDIHSGHGAVRLSLPRGTEVFLAYSRIEDRGDGNARRPSVFPASIGYQVWPLAFESPLARISVRVTSRVRWNAGYQHYRYAEEVLPVQNYRAHTGFTSLSWSF